MKALVFWRGERQHLPVFTLFFSYKKFITKSQPGGGGGGRGRVTEGAQLRRLVVAGVAVGVDLHLDRGQV